MMNRKAFTLIELLVVVAIIGILAAVGVVAYNGYTASAKKAVIKENHNAFANKVLVHVNNNICTNVYRANKGCMEITGGFGQDTIAIDVNTGLSKCALYIRTYVVKDLNPDLWDTSSVARKLQPNPGDVGSYGGKIFELPSWC